MFCGNCGQQLESDAKFCTKCGAAAAPPAVAGSNGIAAQPAFAAPTPAAGGSKAVLFIVVVFAIVMAFLGYEMMQFKRAGKKISGVDVSVSPAQLTLKPGESHTLEASVIGVENTDVGWTVQEGAAGGSVVAAGATAHDGRVFSAGKYTAPSAPGVYHVIATSEADETRASSVTITVAK